MKTFQDNVNFLWSVADEVLRDDFKRGKYPDVILPFTVLQPTKAKVLAQGITFTDAELEKLYQLARHLLRLLPVKHESLPLDSIYNITMSS